MAGQLRIFNTLDSRVESFKPISPEKVEMFVCGPTVQDVAHVGHARTYIFYDVVARYLRHLGSEVKFLVNITDIDEAIMARAKEEGIDPDSLAARYTKTFLDDMDELRIHTVTSFESVSKYINEMVRQISSLISKGHAYLADGDVYFDITTFPEFGKLSHQSISEMALRPTEISSTKRNLVDFSLWRADSSASQTWESPWSRGRPGWHIQDTAVTLKSFGPQYDIHGGARELIYPHHEAEIAQAEALTGVSPFAKYWIHTGLLTVNRRKMSKSEGNYVSIREALRRHGVDRLRLYLLNHHYRSDVEFEESELLSLGEKYHTMKEKAALLSERASIVRSVSVCEEFSHFYEALNDDFDIPKAIDFAMTLVHEGANEGDAQRASAIYNSIKVASDILGVEFLGSGR